MLDRLLPLPGRTPRCGQWRWGRLIRSACACLVATMVSAGCAGLPARPVLPPQAAFAPATQGPLAQALGPMVAQQAPRSGMLPLESGLDAFAARLWLTDRASSSLDVQCYIWRPDRTGRWLLARLRAAADRGVRVRLLLDDNNRSAELDRLLEDFDAHERIEVRMFNPSPRAPGARAWSLLTDFDRINRRMHNKAYIADGLAAIVGGRNAGDEYFGVDDRMQFADLDVLAVGPVVQPTVSSFDAYWNSVSAWPLAVLVGTRTPDAPAGAAEADQRAASESERYAAELVGKPRVERWRAAGPKPADFAWGRAELVVDPPEKVLEQAPHETLMLPRLREVLQGAERSIDLVSPYFVPSEAGIAAMRKLHAAGVRLRVLTNSLAATDVAAVHAGYADRRRALLDAGVELYELKPTPATGGGARRSGRLLGYGASSEASLHAKTFAVDGERVFIGSFNFDPRSIWLNTEIGLLMEHPGLAKRLAESFDGEVPRNAWRVWREGTALRWTETTPTGPHTLTSEPETGWAKKAWIWFLSLLPIDDLL